MRITLNIEKRFVYLILCFIIILAGIFAVYAYVNPITNVGHDANEVGPGTFSTGTYTFPIGSNVEFRGQASVISPAILSVGAWGGSGDQGNVGKIYMHGKTAADFFMIYNNLGSFSILNNIGNNMISVSQTGDVSTAGNINVPTGKNLCLGTDCKSSWPSSGSSITMASCSSGPSYPSPTSGYGPDGMICLDSTTGAGGTWIVTNGPNLPNPIAGVKTIGMGEHKFCFLTGVQITGTSDWRNPGCGIGKNPGNWYLQAGYSGDGAICGARCVD